MHPEILLGTRGGASWSLSEDGFPNALVLAKPSVSGGFGTTSYKQNASDQAWTVPIRKDRTARGNKLFDDLQVGERQESDSTRREKFYLKEELL